MLFFLNENGIYGCFSMYYQWKTCIILVKINFICSKMKILEFVEDFWTSDCFTLEIRYRMCAIIVWREFWSQMTSKSMDWSWIVISVGLHIGSGIMSRCARRTRAHIILKFNWVSLSGGPRRSQSYSDQSRWCLDTLSRF